MGSTKRRRVSYVAALAAASALLLAGCGGESTTGGATSESTAAAGAFPTSGSGEVHLYNWTDYIDPEQLKAFTAETGIEVILDTYDSNETMLAKIQAGATGYDVLVPSDYMVKQMIDLGLLENIGVNTFPNAGNIKDNLVDVYWDKGRNYSAPYMYGSTGIGCNFDAEPGCAKITSWKDYFTLNLPKTDSLKDQVEVVSAALRATGTPAADLCTEDKAAYAKAEELLAGFKPAVIDSDSGIERVVAGTSNVRHAWNGSVHRMTVASNFSGYDNGITGSDAFMDEALKADPAVIVPADKVALLTPTPNCGEAARELYTQVFTTWTSNQ